MITTPLPLVPSDHPSLHSVATPFNVVEELSYIRSLSTTLRDLLKRYNGAGLALPQLGVQRRGFIMDRRLFSPERYRTCINPIVVSDQTLQNKTVATEGCLSLRGKQYWVGRYNEIDVEYFNPFAGRQVKDRLAGLPARVFQHELDHLNGILISDVGTLVDNNLPIS